jgi:broad specificity phosphatase PhoE
MIGVENRLGGDRSRAVRSLEAAFLLDGEGRRLEGATEVWLVRHGACYDGAADPTQDDPPLSPRGREQARRLAARLERAGFDAVHSSPLRRALETARIVTPGVRVDDRLVEVEIEVRDGHLAVVEPADRVRERMRAAVDAAIEAHPGGRVVVVAHALAILAYVTDVMRLDLGALRLLPYYTSVSVVRALGERRMVGSLADVAHLEGDPP